MDRNVGASFTLSVLTVLVFAVVLYQPDPARRAPSLAPAPGPSTTAPGEPSRAGADSGPGEVIEARDPDAPGPAAAPARATTATARSEIGSARAESGAVSVPRDHPSATPPMAGRASRPRLVSRQEPVPSGAGRPRTAKGIVPTVAPRASASPEEPRGAFTKVRPGETLSSIAVRVYGSEDAAERLWMANRDLLERQDAPLGDGAMLRTP